MIIYIIAIVVVLALLGFGFYKYQQCTACPPRVICPVCPPPCEQAKTEAEKATTKMTPVQNITDANKDIPVQTSKQTTQASDDILGDLDTNISSGDSGK
jgi:hypothetical protein